jgi:DNA-binding Lrp family transcriptional regulator
MKRPALSAIVPGEQVSDPTEARPAPSGVSKSVSNLPNGRRFDEIDMRILAELQRDGRITYQRLSELVGLSSRPCLERVRRLERAHVIVGYTARVDLRRLSSVVSVIARILVTQRRGIRAGFERHMRGCPEVIACLEVSGTFTYLVRVVCRDLDAYHRLAESWIEDSSLCIERIESTIVLQAVKDTGI